MNKIFKILSVCIGVFVITFVVLKYLNLSKQDTTTSLDEEVIENKVETKISPFEGDPHFEWSFVSFEEHNIPKVTIHLSAEYPNGEVKSREIETTEGSCNTYDTRDTDVYIQSEMIICYYAGFGQYYKVVESQSGYLIQKKVFEEASPDYNPPQLPFEILMKF